MPNQIPYGFYNPNQNLNTNNNIILSKLNELENKIKIIENEIILLKQNNQNNNQYPYEDNNFKYDYKTSMHMM